MILVLALTRRFRFFAASHQFRTLTLQLAHGVYLVQPPDRCEHQGVEERAESIQPFECAFFGVLFEHARAAKQQAHIDRLPDTRAYVSQQPDLVILFSGQSMLIPCGLWSGFGSEGSVPWRHI